MNHDDAFAVDVKLKPKFCECDHGDDLFFTFGYPLMNGKFTRNGKSSEEEKKLSKKWMKTICQFAKTGYVVWGGAKTATSHITYAWFSSVFIV